MDYPAAFEVKSEYRPECDTRRVQTASVNRKPTDSGNKIGKTQVQNSERRQQLYSGFVSSGRVQGLQAGLVALRPCPCLIDGLVAAGPSPILSLGLGCWIPAPLLRLGFCCWPRPVVGLAAPRCKNGLGMCVSPICSWGLGFACLRISSTGRCS